MFCWGLMGNGDFSVKITTLVVYENLKLDDPPVNLFGYENYTFWLKLRFFLWQLWPVDRYIMPGLCFLP